MANICQEKVPDQLKKLLPSGYDHHVCAIEEKTGTSGFTCTLRLNLKTKEEAKEWLKSFEESSFTTWRISRTFPENTSKCVYRGDLHCFHNTKHSSHGVLKPSIRNTDCQATLKISIRRLVKLSRSTDMHLPKYPATIKLSFVHNHSIESASALRYRPVSEEVRQKFLEMYQSGYSPAAAHNLHQKHLQEEHEENYHVVAADRAVSPDLKWCYNFYADIFTKMFGASSGPTSKKAVPESHSVQKREETGTLVTAISEDATSALKAIENIASSLKKAVTSYPEIFIPAVLAFEKQFNNTSDAGRASGLHTFAKYNCAALALTKRNGRHIGVQPTSVRRRKLHLGRRRCLQSGRPPKESFIDEHGYVKKEEM